jgi:predicted membrane protein
MKLIKFPKRFYLITGLLFWSIPFILAFIFKYVNITYAIILFITGLSFLIRFSIEKNREEKNEKISEETENE